MSLLTITAEALVFFNQGTYLGLDKKVISPSIASSILEIELTTVSLFPTTSPFNISARLATVNFIAAKLGNFCKYKV